jgi:hypothetical protein
VYGKALALFSKFEKMKKQPKHLQLIDFAANEECPWGEVLTLARMKELLIQIPHQFLHPLDVTGIDLPNNISWQAKDLFKFFTWEIWLSLKKWVTSAG